MGINHIRSIFEQTKRDNRAALMPYFTLGYPNPTLSFEMICGIAENGADLIELGIPFSDPLADGPTIQHSTQIALEQGMNVEKGLLLTGELRRAGVKQPLLLMGYVNPILSYGIDNYVRDAADCGADGFIVPDLPIQEAGEMLAACKASQLALIAMLAPNSTGTRIQLTIKHAQGFLYLVSLTGVTGVRDSLADDLFRFIERVRQVSTLPLAVGFGISTPDQAHTVAKVADGVIIGSALIRAANSGGIHAVTGLIKQFRQAMERNI
ncbi:MAG: tryptophan synthase subunit alpha [Anaerolineales bacterium]